MAKDDHAAIIVAVVGESGALTSVRRYPASRKAACEHDILELVRRERIIRVTFIDRVDDEPLTEQDKRRLMRASK